MRTLSILTLLMAVAASAAAQDKSRFKTVVDVERLPVISQDQTGTCWSFATVSFFESEVARIHGEAVDLSEMFPVYHCYMDKAQRYIAAKGKAQFGQGGLSHDLLDVLENRGLVPASAYEGRDNPKSRHNHSEMEKVLKGIADSLAKGRRGPRGDRWKAAYSAVLDTYLGELPQTLAVDGKEMTPVAFTRDVLKLEAANYKTVMSFEHQPFWKNAELKVPDNWMKYDGYLNMPIVDAMQGMDHALGKGYSVAIDIDVSESGFRARQGTATLPDDQEAKDFEITDALRQKLFDTKKTTDDHLMHIVGIAKDADGGKWYITKNSWGTVGPFAGYVYMSEKYVALKMLSYFVHKDGLPAKALSKF